MRESADLRISMLGTVNLAMQQHNVPLIREITISNDGDSDLTGLTLEILPDPAFAERYACEIPVLAAHTTTRITDIPLSPATSFILGLTEIVEGSLRVRLTQADGTEHYNDLYPVTILPYDHWEGIDVLPQYTAAFVTPNHPEVSRILRRACEILGEWTGSPAMDEYQQRDPARVNQQAAAIYEAVRERRIAYCPSPASFAEKGQRVRLCDEIATHGIANCMDLSLLYCACLEAASLHPLLVFVDGHAFSGCWLVQDSFADIVNDDITLLTKRVADGINEIALVETTGVCDGENIDYNTAVALAVDRLKNPENFLMAIDVARARYSRIHPLPLRVMTDGGYVIKPYETERPEQVSQAPTEISAMDLVLNLDGDEVTKQKIWERKLLDLSLRNNLLNTRISRNTLQLVTTDIEEIENAIAEGDEFTILEKPAEWENPNISHGIYRPVSQNDPVAPLLRQEIGRKRLHSYLDKEQLQKSLTYLYRSSRLSMEENGANTLYLAVGLLRWYETANSTRPRFAPILLLPVEMARRSAAGGYVIRGRDEGAMLNITLLEMLRQYFGINIGGLDPLPTGKSGADVALIFNIIRKAVMSHKGWDVEEQVIIGNFYFSKFIMWNDIHSNATLLARNPVVASLISGVTALSSEDAEGSATESDEGPAGSSTTVLLPVSSDSSQLAAIAAATAGESFILHGPPGTGKSQTITNIIANALYHGKKVLFVAEKMAALQVVQRRLEGIGLAPFCLELHSNKAKKSSVLNQLKETIEAVRRKPNEEYAAEADEIEKLRKEIEAHIDAVHRKRSYGMSLYDCFSGYASDDEAQALPLLRQETLTELSRERIKELETVTADYETAVAICSTPAAHPLRGIGLCEYTPAVRSMAADLLQDILDEADTLCQKIGEIQDILGFERQPLDAARLRHLSAMSAIIATSNNLPLRILGSADLTTDIDLLGEAAATGSRCARLHSEILTLYREDLVMADTERIRAEWRKANGKWVMARWLATRAVLKETANLTKDGKPIPGEQLEPALDLAEAYNRETAHLKAVMNRLSYAVKMPDDIDTYDWQRLTIAAANIKTLDSYLSAYCTDHRQYSLYRGSLAQTGRDLNDFRRYQAQPLIEFAAVADRLLNLVEELCRILDARLEATSPVFTDLLRGTASKWLDNIDRLRDWALCNNSRRKLAESGLATLAEAVESGDVEPGLITRTLRKSLYKQLADMVIRDDEELSMFHGLMFDERIARYRALSKRMEALTRLEIYARLASRLPSLQKEAAQSSDIGILQRNIRNNGRGITIRQLFDQIGPLITRMCPCMLMSPISVAQYINASESPFDLVVFDEASQMPTCEAVGAIARGRSVVVVGDPRQMPPTSFFATNQFDEDNPDKEDLESILDDCLALSMPSRHLLWHYRSRHESLIAFSNARYYDNRLLTFPSPDDLATKVTYRYVDGIYDRGRTRQNKAEAEAVVAEIERRLSSGEGRSIGVVTFNTNQQSLIEDKLNEMYQRRPELEKTAMESDEPIFIKNLENVQGDERDIILFSVGYGPDTNGKIALNFGPLNRDGGWRRLNVAVSRARYEMVVYSTLRASDIDLSRTSADGVAGLKAFLEYAEKGRIALPHANAASEGETDHLVESLARILRGNGHDVRTNIGSSGYRIDIGVVDRRDPDRYVLGIICDGRNYSNALSVPDSEITQPGVLASLGWRICRLWSSDWWENPAKSIERVLDTIEDAYNDHERGQEPDLEVVAVEDSSVPGEADIITGWETENQRIEPYIHARLRLTPVSADELVDPMHRARVQERIKEILVAEAPLSKTALTKKLIASFGISRAGSRLTMFIDTQLMRMGVRKTVEGETVFLWNDTQDPGTYDKYRTEARDISEIPEQELMSVIRQIITDQIALSREDLIRHACKTMGFTRLSDKVSAAMKNAVETLLDRGEVVEKSGRVSLSER